MRKVKPTSVLALTLISAALAIVGRAQTLPYPAPDIQTAADSVITFNEIMYHPSGDEPEWIELYNQMSINMDISNWRIEGGIQFQFPTNTVLLANRYLVIATDPVRLRAATGFTNILGPFSKRLANGGETLRLRNNSGRLMDEIQYTDQPPWPIGPGGFGASLAKRDRFFATSPPNNWRASAEPGGTPGRENFPASSPNNAPTLAFSEVGRVGLNFFVEVANYGPKEQSLASCKLALAGGQTRSLGTNVLAPGALLVLTQEKLSQTFASEDPVVLVATNGMILDTVQLKNRGRSRLRPEPDNAWWFSLEATPGAPNSVLRHDEVVINEIMYHHAPVYRNGTIPFAEEDEQWIELYNRAGYRVDLSEWRIAGDIAFEIPFGTALDPDSYLVIARNPKDLAFRYPEINVIGDFSGQLPHRAGRIALMDNLGNPANEVTYYNDHPWPSTPNGGGSSLELRDPRADNTVPENWSASDERLRSRWRHYSYRATAITPVYTPNIYNFHEFRMGLLADGEALVDNVRVIESPASSARQLLQNPDFEAGTGKWRLLGNHSHSFAERDPDRPGNSILHLIATGPTSYLDNRLETTLRVAGALVPIVAGRQYEISFDAKWLAGSPQLRTELYYNKVAATTVLETPSQSGTPGRRNSTFQATTGPTFRDLHHSPPVPTSAQNISVSISAYDPDGVASLALFYSVNGGAWRSTPMTRAAGADSYTGAIPKQTTGAVIQFYVQGTDSLGAVSTYPADGASSRALIKVDSTHTANKQIVRTIMTPADSSLLHAATNMMSDDLLGCTLVHNEREVFYDARIRLHGSMFSRDQPDLTGMAIKLPANHLFRGSRSSIIVRRRGMIETVAKHMLNAVGGLPGNYDDVVYLISHRPDNVGNARLNLANYDDTYVDSQFEGNNSGTVFKLEGIREYQTTQNGQPEGYKLSQPIGWIQTYDISNLGSDPEQYRWSILLQSQRARDDYSGIIAMGKALSLSGTALQAAAARTIDVDEWARLFALQSLLGIADVYGVENPHNFAFYVRPDDGRVVGLQNDWEASFSQPGSASIYGSKNVYKLLRLPVFSRLYQGHLLQMINGLVSSNYVNTWARHIGSVTEEGYATLGSYIGTRSAAVRKQLAAVIPFEITSNNGLGLAVDTPSVTLEGRGWINVHEIRQSGVPQPLPVTWLDDKRWTITLPLRSGTNRIDLTAFDLNGQPVGADSIAVSTSATEFPQRDYIRISELMYHPASPTAAERAAGFTSGDDFEYVELINRGPKPVPLGGIRFVDGITFDFSTSAYTNLAPGQRIVLAANKNGLAFRYGPNIALAGEYAGTLSNSGELIRLVDASGAVIQEFVYSDSGDWPISADGGGNSLEPLDFTGDYNNPANWRASTGPGTPGAPPLVAPTLSGIDAEADGIHLRFHAEPGQTYRVEATSDLSKPAWTIFQQIGPGVNSQEVEVSEALTHRARFYRISVP